MEVKSDRVSRRFLNLLNKYDRAAEAFTLLTGREEEKDYIDARRKLIAHVLQLEQKCREARK